MKRDLEQFKQAVKTLVGASLRSALKRYKADFDVTIGDMRSEDGMFKFDVHFSHPDGKSDLGRNPERFFRLVLAEIEQSLEEQLQGIRIMLVPILNVSASRKASKVRKAG